MEITPEIYEFVQSLNISEDRKQDLYVKILEYGGAVPDNYEAWVQTLYKNLLTDLHRQEARREELEKEHVKELVNIHGQDDTADPYDYVKYEELAERMATLTPKLLDTLVARYVEGRDVREIAHAEGTTETVIYARLSRAKKQLQQ